MEIYKQLYTDINYSFVDVDLLVRAFTHRSAGKVNNERLEYLGDALLSSIMAELLYHKYPKLAEGELTRLRAKLVSGEFLASIAKKINFAAYMLLGKGEVKTGGQNRESILANMVEALVAAVYLDSGYPECYQVVAVWYQDILSQADLLSELRDAKTILQEYLQKQKYALPKYELIEVTGKPHEQVFHVACRVEGLVYFGKGSGVSLQKAGLIAAKDLYQQIQVDK